MKAVASQELTTPPTQDDMVVRMWLHGRQPKTVEAYTSDATKFRTFVGKPLAAATLVDLQDYAATLDGFAHATRARRLAAVKSLFAFAHRLGAIPLDPGAALRVEKVQATSAERIITEADALRMISTERDPRRRCALRLLYLGALRADELCGLRWRDVGGSDRKGFQIQVLGKGAKLRSIPIPAEMIRDLTALSADHEPDDALLPGQDGEPMSYAALLRIVKRAAKRIGLPSNVSPHWWRHASLSHALDNGMPVHAAREMAGHASLATTTRYAHAKKGDGLANYLKG